MDTYRQRSIKNVTRQALLNSGVPNLTGMPIQWMS